MTPYISALMLTIFTWYSNADMAYVERKPLDKKTSSYLKNRLVKPFNLNVFTAQKVRYNEKEWRIETYSQYIPKYSTYGICKVKIEKFHDLRLDTEKLEADSFYNEIRGKQKNYFLVWIPDNERCADNPPESAIQVLEMIPEPDLHFILARKKLIFEHALSDIEASNRESFKDYQLSSLSIASMLTTGDFNYIASFGEAPKRTIHITFQISKQNFIFDDNSSVTIY